ncbi:MAG: DedA family protein [Beijerinckiaceae bacterium]
MLDVFGREALDPILAALRANPTLAIAALFGATAIEGVVLTTFFLSGTVLTVAAGAAIMAGSLDYAAAFGAIFAGFWFGDTANFVLGRHGKPWLEKRGMLAKQAVLLSRGEALVGRHGWLAMFLSRFMGPVRPFATLAAGALKMPALPFHAATVASTAILTYALLHAGMTGASLTGLGR